MHKFDVKCIYVIVSMLVLCDAVTLLTIGFIVFLRTWFAQLY